MMATASDPPKQASVSENIEATEKPPQVETEHVEGTVRLFDANGKIRKIPIPTDDPLDPLTWPTWKRCMIVVALCIYGITGFGVVQSTPIFFAQIVGEYEVMTHGQFDAPDIAQLVSYATLCMGIGNFLFVPLSMMVGRRVVFIFNNVLMLAAIIWAAKSTNFTNHLAARCLQGLSCGIGDCLLPLMILDITFLHRRGSWMSFYWASTAAGSTSLLVAVPFIVQGTTGSWRTNYWFWSGFSAFSLLVSIFFLPETLYPRPPALIDGYLAVTDSYGNVTFVAPEDQPQFLHTNPDQSPGSSAPSTSQIKQMLQIRMQPHGFRRFYVAYVEMALSLLHPSIFFVLILNTLLFGGLVAQGLTYATQLSLPPWSFSAAAVGTVQAGSAIGALLALLLSGSSVDRIAAFLTRRNGGVREPEHLLPNFILPVLLSFAGLVLYGTVAGDPSAHGSKGGWIPVHISFALYFCGFVALSAISGVWIGETLPRWSGPGLVLVCGGRNALSFAISNNFLHWIASQGFQNAYLQLSGVFLGFAIVGGVPLYFWNKAIRRTWGRYLRFDTI